MHYDALSPASVDHLRAAVDKDGMQMLLAFSRLASGLEDADVPSAEQRQRITVGLYFYTETTDPDLSKTPDS
ncbi:hypothetical protein D9M71_510050 [compost metagenome]